MCGKCEAWIPEPGHIEIDGGGVRITYRSGNHAYVRRMSRATFRRFAESGLRQLNAFEVEERGKVLRLRGRKRAGH